MREKSTAGMMNERINAYEDGLDDSTTASKNQRGFWMHRRLSVLEALMGLLAMDPPSR